MVLACCRTRASRGESQADGTRKLAYRLRADGCNRDPHSGTGTRRRISADGLALRAGTWSCGRSTERFRWRPRPRWRKGSGGCCLHPPDGARPPAALVVTADDFLRRLFIEVRDSKELGAP